MLFNLNRVVRTGQELVGTQLNQCAGLFPGTNLNAGKSGFINDQLAACGQILSEARDLFSKLQFPVSITTLNTPEGAKFGGSAMIEGWGESGSASPRYTFALQLASEFKESRKTAISNLPEGVTIGEWGVGALFESIIIPFREALNLKALELYPKTRTTGEIKYKGLIKTFGVDPQKEKEKKFHLKIADHFLTALLEAAENCRSADKPQINFEKFSNALALNFKVEFCKDDATTTEEIKNLIDSLLFETSFVQEIDKKSAQVNLKKSFAAWINRYVNLAKPISPLEIEEKSIVGRRCSICIDSSLAGSNFEEAVNRVLNILSGILEDAEGLEKGKLIILGDTLRTWLYNVIRLIKIKVENCSFNLELVFNENEGLRIALTPAPSFNACRELINKSIVFSKPEKTEVEFEKKRKEFGFDQLKGEALVMINACRKLHGDFAAKIDVTTNNCVVTFSLESISPRKDLSKYFKVLFIDDDSSLIKSLMARVQHELECFKIDAGKLIMHGVGSGNGFAQIAQTGRFETNPGMDKNCLIRGDGLSGQITETHQLDLAKGEFFDFATVDLYMPWQGEYMEELMRKYEDTINVLLFKEDESVRKFLDRKFGLHGEISGITAALHIGNVYRIPFYIYSGRLPYTSDQGYIRSLEEYCNCRCEVKGDIPMGIIKDIITRYCVFTGQSVPDDLLHIDEEKNPIILPLVFKSDETIVNSVNLIGQYIIQIEKSLWQYSKYFGPNPHQTYKRIIEDYCAAILSEVENLMGKYSDFSHKVKNPERLTDAKYKILAPALRQIIQEIRKFFSSLLSEIKLEGVDEMIRMSLKQDQDLNLQIDLRRFNRFLSDTRDDLK